MCRKTDTQAARWWVQVIPRNEGRTAAPPGLLRPEIDQADWKDNTSHNQSRQRQLVLRAGDGQPQSCVYAEEKLIISQTIPTQEGFEARVCS